MVINLAVTLDALLTEPASGDAPIDALKPDTHQFHECWRERFLAGRQFNGLMRNRVRRVRMDRMGCGFNR
jgi:hypothetical protein